MTTPLAGIRVLDMTNVLAGPFCCYHLALLGADVIKIEEPKNGDLARVLGADADLNAAGMGVSFLAQNAGKRSITVNLKHAKGKALFLQLLETADVVVENFRPGVMDRLGLGYEVLKAHRPEIVYCAISGFGQDSPWKGRPAYDQIVQGAAGVMSVTGDDASGPLRAGFPVADTVGGMTAAFAVSAALNARPRGTFIDVSMLDSLLSTMGWAVSNFLSAGVVPKGNGNENTTSAPSGAFQTADGLMNIAANRNEQWSALLRVLDRVELAGRPEYLTREDRKAHRSALKVDLETTLLKRPTAHWVEVLNAHNIPAGPILSVPEILASPQIAERNFVQTHKDVPGLEQEVRIVTSGVLLDRRRPAADAPPPQLGAHTDMLLAELGKTLEEIARLRREGAI